MVGQWINNYQYIPKLGFENATTIVPPMGAPDDAYFINSDMSDLKEQKDHNSIDTQNCEEPKCVLLDKSINNH